MSLIATLRGLWQAAVDAPTTTDFLRKDLTWAAPSGGAGVSDGDKGDVTVSSSGAVWTIDPGVVTYAKMQDVSATDKVLGRSTAGSGDVEEITFTTYARQIADDTSFAAMRTTMSASNVTVNGTTVGDVDLDDASPAAGAGDLNVKWQQTGANVSAYVDVSALAPLLGASTVRAIKTSDTSRTNTTTLADDPDLTFAVTSGVTYIFRIMVWYATNATPDFKWALQGPAVTWLNFVGRGVLPASGTARNTFKQTAFGNVESFLGTTGQGMFLLEGSVLPSASGNVTLQWAQNTLDAGNAAIVMSGSWVEVVEIP